MKFVALVVIIEDNLEEKVIHTAKEVGAGAVTIIHGRNIGLKEKKVFFGLTLEENVSVLLFILPRRLSLKVMKSLKKEYNIDDKESSSMAFTIPLSHVTGIETDELHKFEEEIKNIL
jgi:hypothetical protein